MLKLHSLLQPARVLIATFWVGAIWAIGYVVAPTLFATLADRALAGTIAGSMFRAEAWISLVSSALLLLLSSQLEARQRRLCRYLLVAMLTCTLISHFALQPFMAALRESGGANGMLPEARARFGMLHGVSSILYLLKSLLGVVLVLKIR